MGPQEQMSLPCGELSGLNIHRRKLQGRQYGRSHCRIALFDILLHLANLANRQTKEDPGHGIDGIFNQLLPLEGPDGLLPCKSQQNAAQKGEGMGELVAEGLGVQKVGMILLGGLGHPLNETVGPIERFKSRCRAEEGRRNLAQHLRPPISAVCVGDPSVSLQQGVDGVHTTHGPEKFQQTVHDRPVVPDGPDSVHGVVEKGTEAGKIVLGLRLGEQGIIPLREQDVFPEQLLIFLGQGHKGKCLPDAGFDLRVKDVHVVPPSCHLARMSSSVNRARQSVI